MMDVWVVRALLAVLAVASASAAGFFGGYEAQALLWRRRLRRRAVGDHAGQVGRYAVEGFFSKVLRYLEAMSRRLSLGTAAAVVPVRLPATWFEDAVGKSGLQDSISLEAFNEARVRLCLVGLASGLVFGSLFSTELMAAGGLSGAALGISLPRVALSRQIGQRAQALERELPELLEVVALGLRSGLSFDRSFALYAQHFETAFARECASAQSSWSLGLTTREEALRRLALSYDSAPFQRVVETVVRALRLGSALGGELSQAAEEARAARRSSREEVAAKAPVKMMIPTGVLILPAMLLMVLGPVLLEMMNGF